MVSKSCILARNWLSLRISRTAPLNSRLCLWISRFFSCSSLLPPCFLPNSKLKLERVCMSEHEVISKKYSHFWKSTETRFYTDAGFFVFYPLHAPGATLSTKVLNSFIYEDGFSQHIVSVPRFPEINARQEGLLHPLCRAPGRTWENCRWCSRSSF